MTRSPDFIEAIARGFDVTRAFGEFPRGMSLSEIAAQTGLTRPTVRRILITLSELGYVRLTDRIYELTPKVLDLGMAYVSRQGLWDLARPYLRELSQKTGESCSIAQLDGSDIVYVARVAVPKLVALSVTIGTRFPAAQTSLGKILLAALDEPTLLATLDVPSRSSVATTRDLPFAELDAELRQVRAQGWALTDQQLAPGIRSIAVGIRDGSGKVIAAMNVNVHAAQTSLQTLTGTYRPLLLDAASALSADIAAAGAIPTEELRPRPADEASRAVVSAPPRP